MSPVSWPVVGATLLLGAPAIWAAAVEGTLSPDVAATRVGLCLLAAWAALSLMATLAGRAATTAPVPPAPDASVEDETTRLDAG